MKNVAHISFKGGGLIIPVHTPYEREVLIEHLEVSAKRHGSVRLDINRRRWTISMNNGAGEGCTSCTRRPDTLTYRVDWQSLCAPCARRTLGTEARKRATRTIDDGRSRRLFAPVLTWRRAETRLPRHA